MAAPELKKVKEGEKVSDTAFLSLSGRYMNPDHGEYECALESVELPDIKLKSDGECEEGTRVVVYLEELGRLEGDITDKTEDGFVLSVDLSKPRLVKINDKLAELQNREDKSDSNLRRHNRFEPTNQTSHLTLSDGRTYPCEVVDISMRGAAINVEVIPSIGTYVMLGKTQHHTCPVPNIDKRRFYTAFIQMVWGGGRIPSPDKPSDDPNISHPRTDPRCSQ